MPIWLQVANIALAIVIAPSVGIVVKEVLSLRVRMTEIEVELTNIKGRCTERLQWMQNMDDTLKRVDRAVVAVATKLGVQLEGGG